MISLLVAASSNHAIGKNNQLLWHLPKDLRYFKNLTWGMVVIMGRKTFESVNKPLPGRINIVITSQPDWNHEEVWVAHSLQHALDLARATHCKEIFVIGGGEIYRQSMPLAHKIYMTRVHAELDGDTFFPEIAPQDWDLIFSQENSADEKHAFSFRFETWIRK